MGDKAEESEMNGPGGGLTRGGESTQTATAHARPGLPRVPAPGPGAAPARSR